MRLTVRITWSASPDSRLPRLAPPLASSPRPVEWVRSISAQSAGPEHATSFAVSFTTQRKAGMFSFEPSRIPAWLAPVWDERSVSHSANSWLPSWSQRAMCRRVAVPHRPLQHRQGEAVDLEEDDPRRVGPRQLAGAARDSPDDAVRVRVVVVRPEDHVEHDADRGRDERDAESGPEGVDREIAAGHAIRCEQHQRVEDEDEQQAEDEHQRQPQRRNDRRQQCVEHGDDRGRHERAPEVVHVRARHDPGRGEERRGGQDPGQDQRQRPELRARGLPGGLGWDW